jgi:two-component system, OmpR family, response regulator
MAIPACSQKDVPLYHVNPADWTSIVPPDAAACPLNVLIVTRDRDRRERIAAELQRQRCRAVSAAELPPPGRLKADRYNLLVLDVRLEPLDGFELLRRVRTQSDIPVIMMSDEPTDAFDCVMGLELGADDFLGSPINTRELVARGRAILRRSGGAPSAPAEQRGGYRFNGWELHRSTRTVHAPDGRAVLLGKNAYALLLAFLKAPNRPLSRIQLMQATRPHEDIYDRSIDVQVLRLRRKLETVSGGARMIRTDRSFGYIFDAAVEPLF